MCVCVGGGGRFCLGIFQTVRQLSFIFLADVRQCHPTVSSRNTPLLECRRLNSDLPIKSSALQTLGERLSCTSSTLIRYTLTWNNLDISFEYHHKPICTRFLIWDSLPLENMEGTALHRITFWCLLSNPETLPPVYSQKRENLDLNLARRHMSCCRRSCKTSSELTPHIWYDCKNPGFCRRERSSFDSRDQEDLQSKQRKTKKLNKQLLEYIPTDFR